MFPPYPNLTEYIIFNKPNYLNVLYKDMDKLTPKLAKYVVLDKHIT